MQLWICTGRLRADMRLIYPQHSHFKANLIAEFMLIATSVGKSKVNNGKKLEALLTGPSNIILAL